MIVAAGSAPVNKVLINLFDVSSNLILILIPSIVGLMSLTYIKQLLTWPSHAFCIGQLSVTIPALQLLSRAVELDV